MTTKSTGPQPPHGPRPPHQHSPAPEPKVKGLDEEEEDALDEGLEESFPASDPLAVSVNRPARPKRH